MLTRRIGALVAGFFAVALLAPAADAVPAFAAKTGMHCSACHVGGFGPQLTPVGRAFKLAGYTMDAGAFTFPVSAMAVASYLNTAKGQDPAPAPHYSPNDNVTLDQASLFLAGGIGDHFGGLAQFTYDGVARHFSWDNLDIRLTDQETVYGTNVQYGLSFNNNPSIQDPWNSLPAWGYPYTGSSLAPSPAASTIFNGGLAQAVLGTTVYALWDQTIYTEAGAYWTPSDGFLKAFGADSGPGPIDGAAPYVRVAYQQDYGDQNFEIGAFGFFPSLHPGGDTTAGTTDNYNDYGIDGSYQFLGDNQNIYTVNARYTHEQQGLGASQFLGLAANRKNTLDDLRFDASYYWHNELGGTVQWFDTWGSADSALYADAANFKPDSNGFVFQLDATPWGNENSPLGERFNLRVGLQYTLYTKFDGAVKNYDGAGRSASDNNTLRLFTWFAL
jgi:hypothetical protein